jgi:hypothetical protein
MSGLLADTSASFMIEEPTIHTLVSGFPTVIVLNLLDKTKAWWSLYQVLRYMLKLYISKSDGVHLTPVGNDISLNILQGAIEYFMSSNLCAKHRLFYNPIHYLQHVI